MDKSIKKILWNQFGARGIRVNAQRLEASGGMFL
jgi:hypothetical protein